MNWDAADYTLFGIMLTVAGVIIGLAIRMKGNKAYQQATAVAVFGAFIMIWMNLAVGIIGPEDNPLNLMYEGVVAVGILATIIARFHAEGMFWALVATAVAQVIVAVIAQIEGHFTWVLTVIFTMIWLGSAWLFRKAKINFK